MDQFGSAVALSGQTGVVGAPFDDHVTVDAGSAYVFVAAAGLWSQQARLWASDAAASDGFGGSVAISGNTALVGAKFDDLSARSNAGSAYVYVRSGSIWPQQSRLFASDAAASDLFGASVAISGDLAVIGAPGDDHAGGTDAGAAYVFVRSGSTWMQQWKLTASDAATSEQFGFSVAIDGNTVVVGAPADDHAGGVDAGSAYTFFRSGNVWTEQSKLTAGDAAPGDGFGRSVSLSGETVVAGAMSDDHVGGVDAGSAYVFTRAGGVWTQEARLVAVDAAPNDRFGASVAISLDRVVVGASHADHAGGTDAGAGYLFTRDGSTWDPGDTMIADDAAAFDELGSAVAISGGSALAGAWRKNFSALNVAGAAYVFDVGPFVPVPVASPWSLAIATIVIFGTGSIVLIRRRGRSDRREALSEDAQHHSQPR